MNAAVPAFFSYFGFSVVVFMAEEIKKPERTIPLSLTISMLIVMALYLSVTLALPSIIPWRELADTQAPFGAASALFLPKWFASAISAAALLAAATSINGAFLMFSRSFLALGRDQILPSIFSRLHARTNEPIFATLLVALLIVLGIFLGASLVQYASVAVVIFMIFGLVWALALLRLPSRFPQHYQQASFQLSLRMLWVVVWLKVVTSIAFGYIGIREHLGMSLGFLGIVLLGVVYYFVRRLVLKRRGIRFDDLLRQGADELLESPVGASSQ